MEAQISCAPTVVGEIGIATQTFRFDLVRRNALVKRYHLNLIQTTGQQSIVQLFDCRVG